MAQLGTLTLPLYAVVDGIEVEVGTATVDVDAGIARGTLTNSAVAAAVRLSLGPRWLPETLDPTTAPDPAG